MAHHQHKATDLETLAKMAARLAGRDPDEHLHLVLADEIIHSGPLWGYSDFLARAEAAYAALERPERP